MFFRILAAGMVLLGIGRAPLSIAQQPRFSAEEVRRAADYSRSQKQVSLIVWQDGQILREEHRGDAPAMHHIRSISKPLWALAVLAVADSRGRNIDSPASEVFGEWKSVAGKSKITVRQLLDHTSGLASGNHLHRSTVLHAGTAALKEPLHHAPGKAFEYGAANYEILGEWIRRTEGAPATEPERSLQRFVIVRLGAAPAVLRRDRSGTPYIAAGMNLRAPDLLRVGRLYLDGGRAGLFSVIPSASLQDALRGSSANPIFGAGVWSNANATKPDAQIRPIESLLSLPPEQVDWSRIALSSAAPPDMMTLLGSSGQRVYIIPSMRAVIVRLGDPADFSDEIFWNLLRADQFKRAKGVDRSGKNGPA